MKGFQDGFISYGQADSQGFVIQLHQRLQQAGLNVWFDPNDISLGGNVQNQIDDGIEKSDNFLFVISPQAVNSPCCLKEIQLALQHNKRIIPLWHVEQISQETWQQRNPTGTANDWEDYQAKGLHSCFPNIHPKIRRINGIYFREGIDDFERSLQSLLDLFHRHRHYVHHHTVFLSKALAWERHQKQRQYLLVEEERIEAAFWLRQRFTDEPPPCEPTDLHCEFIGESTKNANNRLTQVFFCYASTDRAIVERISRSLQREGYTLWSQTTDVKEGTNLETAIFQGIEGADRILCLLSPDFINSETCQRYIAHAFAHNKPVIPLRLRISGLMSFSSTKRKRGLGNIYERLGVAEDSPVLDQLRALQPIHLPRDDDEAAEYQASIDRLLQELNKEPAYYEQHKILLVMALRWQEHGRLPSLLLRGNTLTQAKAWMEASHSQTLHPPTALQEALIAASLEQPSQVSTTAFLCYSPIDSDFTRQLNQALQGRNKSTWFDQDCISLGADTRLEIQHEMATADNVVFVLSPNSLHSSTCLEQLDYAKHLQKRIVPVLNQPVSPEDVPSILAQVQAIDFTDKKNFQDCLGELISTLETERDYVRMHTQLQGRAMAWDAQGRDHSFLLRGKDRAAAEAWLKQAGQRSPSATALQTQLIMASRALPARRVKARTCVTTSLVVTALIAITRFFGGLQGVELAAYDHLLQFRRSEPQDDRLLIVGLDEPSIHFLNTRYAPGRGTLPDAALLDALQALEVHHPRVVGLDFYQDFAAEPALAQYLQHSKHLISICKRGDGEAPSDMAIAPPPELSLEQIGFSNFVNDARGGRFVRRQLLLLPLGNSGICDPNASLSLVLAQQYLTSENQAYRSPKAVDGTYIQDMAWGNVAIPQLLGSGSPYQNIDHHLGGYQTLLTYRLHQHKADASVPTVSLQALIQGQVDPALIADRVVLIGFTAPSLTTADFWNTPYGKLPGVTVQAQMTSQLISAVLDHRPLIRGWSIWGETLWIFGWGVVGGVLFWHFRSLNGLVIGGAIALVSLYGISGGMLVYGHQWLPLVPAAIALACTGATVGYLNHQLRKD